jgi:hypothetical protein
MNPRLSREEKAMVASKTGISKRGIDLLHDPRLEITDLLAELGSQRDFGKEKTFGDVDNDVGFGRGYSVGHPQPGDISVSPDNF